MSHRLTQATARFAAILFEGRGADGSIGAEAAACSIPSGQFRRSFAPLRDAAEPTAVLHRGVYLWWAQSLPKPESTNARNQKILSEHTLRVEVGYLMGTAGEGFVHPAPATTESASTSVREPSLIANSDASRIAAALEWPELYQDSSDDPAIVDVQLIGIAGTEQAQPWLLVLTQDFRVRLWGTRSGYPPA